MTVLRWLARKLKLKASVLENLRVCQMSLDDNLAIDAFVRAARARSHGYSAPADFRLGGGRPRRTDDELARFNP
jgi:hypothetical protein